MFAQIEQLGPQWIKQKGQDPWRETTGINDPHWHFLCLSTLEKNRFRSGHSTFSGMAIVPRAYSVFLENLRHSILNGLTFTRTVQAFASYHVLLLLLQNSRKSEVTTAARFCWAQQQKHIHRGLWVPLIQLLDCARFSTSGVEGRILSF